MTVEIPPVQDPDQDQITIWREPGVWTSAWWATYTISEVPADSVGWLLAQGWRIQSVSYDTTTVPATPTYNMIRESLQNMWVLQSLLNSYTSAYNDARYLNNERYNQVVKNWTEMIETSQQYFDTLATRTNDHVLFYMGQVNTWMTEINNLINTLETEYDTHARTAPEYLDGLGTTELARIREEYASTLGEQRQDLIDRGMWSSAVAADITARNTRDKEEAIAALNDRLNREKLDNQHKLYEQQTNMRSRMIADKMTAYVRRLDAYQQMYEEEMRLMMYQLDERNKLLVGLYGFVERREDIGPEFKDLSQVCTALGDAGGGWITP
jgi:hypothetical protein